MRSQEHIPLVYYPFELFDNKENAAYFLQYNHLYEWMDCVIYLFLGISPPTFQLSSATPEGWSMLIVHLSASCAINI